MGVKGHYKVITMGQSFHWMEGKVIIDKIYDLVESEGGVVITGTSQPPQNKTATEVNEIIKRAIIKYLGPKRRAGKYLYKPTGESWENELFPNSAFKDFNKCIYVVEIERSVKQIIDNLFSMSWASKKLLGEQALDFENEIRQELNVILADKNYMERVQFDVYFLAK